MSERHPHRRVRTAVVSDLHVQVDRVEKRQAWATVSKRRDADG